MVQKYPGNDMKFVSHILIIICLVSVNCGSVRHKQLHDDLDKYKAEAEYYKNRCLVLQELVKRYRHEPCANFRYDEDTSDIEIIRRKDW